MTCPLNKAPDSARTGTPFSVAHAGIATLRSTDDALTDWMLGGTCNPPVCGLLRLSCLHSAGAEPAFTLIGPSGGSRNHGVHAGIGSGHGTVLWSVQSAPVPEPAPAARLALGLLRMAGLRVRHIA